jgi:hypothetical protein
MVLASKVEPYSRKEIKAFLDKESKETICRKFEGDEENDGMGC